MPKEITSSTKPHKTGKQIQSTILKYLRDHRYTELGFKKYAILAYKVEIANERGVPDLLLCVKGQYVGIEIKGHNDKTSAIQLAQGERIIAAGGSFHIVTSMDEFKSILTNLREK